MRTSLSKDILGSNNNSNSSSVFLELTKRIEALPFPAFQVLALLWLSAAGFEHIRNLGRSHRRGRRSVGNVDFLAVLPRSGMPLAIQIRHWNTPIQARAVDELRGTILRNGIPSGIIVSNQKFYPQAKVSASEFPGRRVQLVSSTDIASSLFSLRLGIKVFENGSLAVDEAFFRTLQLLSLASTGETSHHEPQPKPQSKALLATGDPCTEVDAVSGFRPRRTTLFLLIAAIIVGFLLGLVLGGFRWPN